MITLEDALRIARAVGAETFNIKCTSGEVLVFHFRAEELLAALRQVEAETIERCAKDEREAKAKAILAFASWLPRDYESAVFQAGIEQARHLAQGYTQYLLASDNAETILSTPPAEQGRKACPDCVGAQPEGRKCLGCDGEGYRIVNDPDERMAVKETCGRCKGTGRACHAEPSTTKGGGQ